MSDDRLEDILFNLCSCIKDLSCMVGSNGDKDIEDRLRDVYQLAQYVERRLNQND